MKTLYRRSKLKSKTSETLFMKQNDRTLNKLDKTDKLTSWIL